MSSFIGEALKVSKIYFSPTLTAQLGINLDGAFNFLKLFIQQSSTYQLSGYISSNFLMLSLNMGLYITSCLELTTRTSIQKIKSRSLCDYSLYICSCRPTSAYILIKNVNSCFLCYSSFSTPNHNE